MLILFLKIVTGQVVEDSDVVIISVKPQIGMIYLVPIIYAKMSLEKFVFYLEN